MKSLDLLSNWVGTLNSSLVSPYTIFKRRSSKGNFNLNVLATQHNKPQQGPQNTNKPVRMCFIILDFPNFYEN